MNNVINIGSGKLWAVNKDGDTSKYHFLEPCYNEAVDLLQKTGLYLKDRDKRKDCLRLSVEDMVLHTIAVSHITVSLTNVMSWLLALRNLDDGEITEQQMISKDYRLKEVANITTSQYHSFSDLPEPVPWLLDKSFCLYERVRRIEKDLVECWKRPPTGVEN